MGPTGTSTYGYDFLGRRTKTVDPDTGTSTSTYTSGDQVATSTDARGKTLRHVYDNRGRQIGLYDGDTTDPAKLLTKTVYDTVKLGKLTSTVRRAPDGTTFTDTVTGYTEMGDAKGSTFAIGNPAGGGIASGLPTSYATAMTYGFDARPDTVTWSAAATGVPAETMQYSYNSLGAVSSMATGITKVVGGIAYDDLGRISTMKLGDVASPSLYLSRQYETGTGRLTRAWADRGTAATISDHTYSYTDAGDVTKDADNPTITGQGATTADTQCYRYDSHQRITAAFTPGSGNCADDLATQIGGPAPYWQTWSYNPRGMRTSQATAFGSGSSVETVTSSYPAAAAARPNAVTGTSTRTSVAGGPAGPATTASYGYDAAGNTTSRPAPTTGTGGSGGSQSLTYSSEGKPEKITTSSGDIDYFYGSDGEVLVKNTPTKRTLYIGSDEVTMTKSDQAVSAVRDYDTPLGTVATRTSLDGVSWLIPNSQNTSQVSIRSSSDAIKRRWLTPFGQSRTPSTGTGGSVQSNPVAGWTNDHAFLNKPFDSNTGLSDVGARMYDPGLGRFISPDPLLDASGPVSLDPYVYAENNPIAKSDPSGLRPVNAYGNDSEHGTMLRPNPRHPGHWMPVSHRTVIRFRADIRQWHRIGVQHAIAYRHEVERRQAGAHDRAIAAQHRAQLRAAAAARKAAAAKQERKRNWWKVAALGAAVVGLTVANAAQFGLDPVTDGAEVGTGAGLADAVVGDAAEAGGSEAEASEASEASESAGSCRNSFTGVTLVLMGDGSKKPIKEVKLGDLVMATDPKTGERGPRRVVNLIRHRGLHTMVAVGLADGSKVDATDRHPVWVANRDGGAWVDAIDLRPGDVMVEADGDRVVVDSLGISEQDLQAYNLTVEGLHTYYVGTDSVLVHKEPDPVSRTRLLV